jgi:hypothetical protein
VSIQCLVVGGARRVHYFYASTKSVILDLRIIPNILFFRLCRGYPVLIWGIVIVCIWLGGSFSPYAKSVTLCALSESVVKFLFLDILRLVYMFTIMIV